MLCIGLMIVKNEADILLRSLDSYAKWLDGIVALDNGSTDGSLEILGQHPIVKKLAVDAGEFNETRLVPKIIELASDIQADWYVESDADEIFNPDFRNVMQATPSPFNVIGARLLYMLDDTHYYRERPVYRIFRKAQFSFGHIRKLHHGKIPIAPHLQRKVFCPFHIKHFQIRSYKQGMCKYNNYVQLDPTNKYQRGYEHLRVVAEMWQKKDFSALRAERCN